MLVQDDGKEIIVLGKGIGFGKKAGEEIQNNQVDQIFLPIDKIKYRQLLELVESIPQEYFEITQDLLVYAEEYLESKLNSSIYFTLMDHLHFAVERARKGIITTNRVYWEIKSYYVKEFHVGEVARRALEDKFFVELPKEEAANIAFHLINAQETGDTQADGMKYAKLIGTVVNLVRYSINVKMDVNSIHYSRFITHVKFFVERFYSDQMISSDDNGLFDNIAVLYPQAMNSAFKVKDYLKQVHDKDIPNDEVTYLAVHINRLMNQTQIDE